MYNKHYRFNKRIAKEYTLEPFFYHYDIEPEERVDVSPIELAVALMATWVMFGSVLSLVLHASNYHQEIKHKQESRKC